MRRSSQRRLRGLVRRLLRELDVTAPLDVEDLCRRLGDHRGRPIVLYATESLPMTAAYALWVSTDTTDYIVFQRQTSPLHRRHLILHEIGHIVAEHGSDGEGLTELMPTLNKQTITTSLRRHAYDTDKEREAEYIASTILRWASDIEALPVQPVGLPAAANRALTDQRGWL